MATWRFILLKAGPPHPTSRNVHDRPELALALVGHRLLAVGREFVSGPPCEQLHERPFRSEKRSRGSLSAKQKVPYISPRTRTGVPTYDPSPNPSNAGSFAPLGGGVCDDERPIPR
jgi:hypothetical protein